MSNTFLHISIKVPVPSGRMDQAKTLVALSEPLDALRAALPEGYEMTDKVVTERGPSATPRKPRAAPRAVA